jgi:hypothetical protein
MLLAHAAYCASKFGPVGLTTTVDAERLAEILLRQVLRGTFDLC